MTPAKVKELELLDKIQKATSYKYQEYAGANYSTFYHDTEVLKEVASIVVEEILETKPKRSVAIFWSEVLFEIKLQK